MKITIKRIAAFVFDILAVYLISSVLSMTPLNPNYDATLELDAEYREKAEYYQKLMNESEDDEAVKVFDEFITYYKSSVKKVNKMNVYSEAISSVVVILYFVVFAYFFDGETVGKRLMRLKVVDMDEKKAPMWRLLVRTLLIYGIPFSIFNTIFAFTLNKDAFLTSYVVLYIISFILEIAIILTIFLIQDNRGVHDLVAGTKVVEVERK